MKIDITTPFESKIVMKMSSDEVSYELHMNRQTELASAADVLAARTGRLNLPLRELYLPPEQAD